MSKNIKNIRARVEGFEPSTLLLESKMIPFHHTRIFEVSIGFEPI